MDFETGDVWLKRDDGEGRIRAASYLTILNTELPPDEPERFVGLAADEAWKKGEPIKAGRRGTRRFNGVSYESQLDELAPPSEHVRRLLERLAPFADGIAALADLPSTHGARVWIVEHTEQWTIDTTLAPPHAAVVAAMHTDLTFSSYFYNQDDDE